MSDLATQLEAYGEGSPAMEQAAKTVCEYIKSKTVEDTIRSLAYELHNRIYRGLEDNLASDLNDEVAKRAENLLMKVLRGDEDAAKALFKCGSGRREAYGPNTGRPWAKLINGHLHQTPAVEFRAAIVEAHSELLKDERILDLEAAVEGLKAQLKVKMELLEQRF